MENSLRAARRVGKWALEQGHYWVLRTEWYHLLTHYASEITSVFHDMKLLDLKLYTIIMTQMMLSYGASVEEKI